MEIHPPEKPIHTFKDFLLQAAIQFAEDLRAHRLKGHGTVKLDFTYYFGLPSATSWSTAQAAGAVVYMPYEDVQRYASIYDKQGKFDALQDRLNETVLAAVPYGDFDNWTPGELRDWAQRVQRSLSYLREVEGLARSLRDEYDGALR